LLYCGYGRTNNITTGDTNQTHLYHLLQLYVLTLPDILSKHCADLIQSVLSPSILFEHDPPELFLWLEALPRGIRAPDANGPNDEELVDERETMVAVLDKCIRDCIKSPWKYVERTMGIYTGGEAIEDEGLEGYSPSSAASPLLMTLLEFLEGILKGEPTLPPSAALAISTYLRRLLLGISLKQPNIQYVLRVASILDLMLVNDSEESMVQKYSTEMTQSIRREFGMLRRALLRMGIPADIAMLGDEDAVIVFLNQVEILPVGEYTFPL
jgi:nucleolar pre-ribosomal-associated protein 1